MKKIIFVKIPFLFLSLLAFKVEPVIDSELKSGCVDCHFVYQAEFLPKQSWIKLLNKYELANHFGKKVELSKSLREKFLAYYLENASDSKNTKYRRKINNSLSKNKIYSRISKVPYIKSKHEDLDKEMFIDNPKVKSYSNCKACHKAEKGIFEEDEVDVPNWNKSFFFGWSME